jgi:hypothetical protein
MSLEKPMSLWFVAGTKISSHSVFDSCFVVLSNRTQSESDNHGDACGPGLRQPKLKPPAPKSLAGQVKPPPAEHNLEDERNWRTAVLR